MTTRSHCLGLSSWVIQDGNYDDFRVGMDVAFALEFYAESGLQKVEGDCLQELTQIRGSRHEASGQIIYLGVDWWVIDFGIPAYRNETPPKQMNVGDWVQGEIDLGIDPFFYFERLAHTRGAPALIANWRVDRIQIQTAPYIKRGNFMVRDESLLGWRDISETNACKDDDGRAEYALWCTMLDHDLRRFR